MFQVREHARGRCVEGKNALVPSSELMANLIAIGLACVCLAPTTHISEEVSTEKSVEAKNGFRDQDWKPDRSMLCPAEGLYQNNRICLAGEGDVIIAKNRPMSLNWACL